VEQKKPLGGKARGLADDAIRIAGVVGLAIMIVGAIVGYVKQIRELPAWWHGLFIIGVALVLLAVIKIVFGWRERKVETPREANPRAISRDGMAAFYCKREHMDKTTYDGLRNELASAKKEIRFAWHGGQAAIATTSADQWKKISQLILLHPWNANVDQYGTETAQDARENIVKTTRAFQAAGRPVKWFDGPFSIITVVDPDIPECARVRVEPWLVLVDAQKWQNYVIYQKDNDEAFTTVEKAFEAMWAKAIEAPKGEELEKFRNEKPRS
jgi:hypothetical protein